MANNQPGFAELAGLARSLLIYYAVPGRAGAWRRFYSQFVQPGDLCFDLGAHMGSRSGAMLALSARVVALEPQPLLAAVLRRFYGRNPYFTLRELAVARQPGQMEMLLSRRNPTISTLSGEWADEVSRTPGFDRADWDAAKKVEATTLDTLIAEFGLPVFCKIDIEGGELDALLGLSAAIPHISFEYVPAVMQRALDCIDRIATLGAYKFNLVKSEFPRFVLPDWIDGAETKHHLQQIPPHERAGEVYASLQDASR